VVFILCALGLSALREFVLVDPVTDPAAVVDVAEPAPTSPPTQPASPDLPVEPGSIAVLPFASMSPDPDNAFLAEGMAEELLNVLSSNRRSQGRLSHLIVLLPGCRGRRSGHRSPAGGGSRA